MTEQRFTVNYRENTRLYEVKDNLHILDCGGFAIEYNAKKCCEELNALYEENERLKQAYAQLKHRHSLLHDVCIAECDRDSYRKDIASLEKENEQLRTKNNAYIQDIEVFKEENTHLKLENEELQVRNDRQAKRLGELYELMAKKDWESLTEIIDDFKRCEEQLQREWRTYE